MNKSTERSDPDLFTEEVNRVAVSSRCRIARNVKGFPFPNRATREEKVRVSRKILSFIEDNGFFSDYRCMDLSRLSGVEKAGLLEENVISSAFSSDIPLGRILCHNGEKTESMMINEEDHLRIQVRSRGLNLKNCWQRINRLDDELESGIDFAFSPEFGYRTACPTNMGTGLRASVMLHLPATFMTGSLDALTQYTAQLGLVIRGIHGEGSQALGNSIQLSNQEISGLAEEGIIEKMESITRQIIDRELNARDALLMESRDRTLDSLHRDFAILKSARLLGLGEFMDMLSMVRMGVEMKLLQGIPLEVLDGLQMMAMPAHLEMHYDCGDTPEKIDRTRAEMVRQFLSPYPIT